MTEEEKSAIEVLNIQGDWASDGVSKLLVITTAKGVVVYKVGVEAQGNLTNIVEKL